MANARTSPSFENIDLTPPPTFGKRDQYKKGDEERFLKRASDYMKQTSEYLMGVTQWSQDLDIAVRGGWLVSDARVISISAEKVIANSIFTQDLFVGGESKIEIKGTTNTIEVYDNQATPELRTRIGKMGAGNTNYGQQWYDASGSLVMEVADVVYIDGVIIGAGTILGTSIKANDITATQIKASTITATELNITTLSSITANVGTLTAGTINATVSINAGAIDTGQITVSSGLITAILVENSGDITMESSALSASSIFFDTDGSVNEGSLTYSNAADQLIFQAESGTDIIIRHNGTSSLDSIDIIADNSGQDIRLRGAEVQLGDIATSGINMLGVISNDLDPSADSNYNIGSDKDSGGKQWATIYVDTVHSPDMLFQNGWYFVEGYAYGQQNDKYFILFDNEDNLRAVWDKVHYYTDPPKPLSECPLLQYEKKETLSDKLRNESSSWKKTSEGWKKKWYRCVVEGKTMDWSEKEQRFMGDDERKELQEGHAERKQAIQDAKDRKREKEKKHYRKHIKGRR